MPCSSTVSAPGVGLRAIEASHIPADERKRAAVTGTSISLTAMSGFLCVALIQAVVDFSSPSHLLACLSLAALAALMLGMGACVVPRLFPLGQTRFRTLDEESGAAQSRAKGSDLELIAESLFQENWVGLVQDGLSKAFGQRMQHHVTSGTEAAGKRVGNSGESRPSRCCCRCQCSCFRGRKRELAHRVGDRLAASAGANNDPDSESSQGEEDFVLDVEDSTRHTSGSRQVSHALMLEGRLKPPSPPPTPVSQNLLGRARQATPPSSVPRLELLSYVRSAAARQVLTDQEFPAAVSVAAQEGQTEDESRQSVDSDRFSALLRDVRALAHPSITRRGTDTASSSHKGQGQPRTLARTFSTAEPDSNCWEAMWEWTTWPLARVASDPEIQFWRYPPISWVLVLLYWGLTFVLDTLFWIVNVFLVVPMLACCGRRRLVWCSRSAGVALRRRVVRSIAHFFTENWAPLQPHGDVDDGGSSLGSSSNAISGVHQLFVPVPLVEKHEEESIVAKHRRLLAPPLGARFRDRAPGMRGRPAKNCGQCCFAVHSGCCRLCMHIATVQEPGMTFRHSTGFVSWCSPLGFGRKTHLEEEDPWKMTQGPFFSTWGTDGAFIRQFSLHGRLTVLIWALLASTVTLFWFTFSIPEASLSNSQAKLQKLSIHLITYKVMTLAILQLDAVSFLFFTLGDWILHTGMTFHILFSAARELASHGDKVPAQLLYNAVVIPVFEVCLSSAFLYGVRSVELGRRRHFKDEGRKAQLLLSVAKEQHRAAEIARQSSEAIMVLDPVTYRITHSTPAFTKMFGWFPWELQASPHPVEMVANSKSTPFMVDVGAAERAHWLRMFPGKPQGLHPDKHLRLDIPRSMKQYQSMDEAAFHGVQVISRTRGARTQMRNPERYDSDDGDLTASKPPTTAHSSSGKPRSVKPYQSSQLTESSSDEPEEAPLPPIPDHRNDSSDASVSDGSVSGAPMSQDAKEVIVVNSRRSFATPGSGLHGPPSPRGDMVGSSGMQSSTSRLGLVAPLSGTRDTKRSGRASSTLQGREVLGSGTRKGVSSSGGTSVHSVGETSAQIDELSLLAMIHQAPEDKGEPPLSSAIAWQALVGDLENPESLERLSVGAQEASKFSDIPSIAQKQCETMMLALRADWPLSIMPLWLPRSFSMVLKAGEEAAKRAEAEGLSIEAQQAAKEKGQENGIVRVQATVAAMGGIVPPPGWWRRNRKFILPGPSGSPMSVGIQLQQKDEPLDDREDVLTGHPSRISVADPLRHREADIVNRASTVFATQNQTNLLLARIAPLPDEAPFSDDLVHTITGFPGTVSVVHNRCPDFLVPFRREGVWKCRRRDGSAIWVRSVKTLSPLGIIVALSSVDDSAKAMSQVHAQQNEVGKARETISYLSGQIRRQQDLFRQQLRREQEKLLSIRQAARRDLDLRREAEERAESLEREYMQARDSWESQSRDLIHKIERLIRRKQPSPEARAISVSSQASSMEQALTMERVANTASEASRPRVPPLRFPQQEPAATEPPLQQASAPVAWKPTVFPPMVLAGAARMPVWGGASVYRDPTRPPSGIPFMPMIPVDPHQGGWGRPPYPMVSTLPSAFPPPVSAPAGPVPGGQTRPCVVLVIGVSSARRGAECKLAQERGLAAFVASSFGEVPTVFGRLCQSGAVVPGQEVVCVSCADQVSAVELYSVTQRVQSICPVTLSVLSSVNELHG
jgi:hypothetical protein